MRSVYLRVVHMFNTDSQNGVICWVRAVPSLISQARRRLHSDNINILEHFGRRLQDAFDVLNIFKSRCEDVLASRELINIISDVISQTEMLLNRTEDALSTDREYVMQLLEASSVRMDEIVDNHSGDLGRPRCNIEKEELHRLFDIYHSWTKVASTLGVSERTLRRRRAEFGMTISDSSGPRKTYTEISSNDLNTVVKEILDILPDAGETYVIGVLRQRSIHAQRHRIRAEIEEVDPASCSLRRTISIVRRVYNVPDPNSLWYVVYS